MSAANARVPGSAAARKVHPLVSVGLPTHNGSKYLADALDCLVRQDYPNLEILISDNASTDHTFAIASRFARGDPRIRIVRQAENIGPTANFNLVFRETKGPLFMWAADDDQWDPSYVAACVSALEQQPSAVLACSRLRFIGDIDSIYEQKFALFDNPDLSSSSVRGRIRELLSRNGWYAIYGLIRRDVLEATRLATQTYGSDVVLLTELALQGPFVRVDRPLFRYRLTQTRAANRGPWDGIPDRVRAAPFTHLQEQCGAAIGSSDLAWSVRFQAWLGMAEAAFLRPTPLHEWIRHEAKPRFWMAVADRNPIAIVKYGLLRTQSRLRRMLDTRSARRRYGDPS